MPVTRAAIVAAACLSALWVLTAACAGSSPAPAGSSSPPPSPTATAITVTSSAFSDGGRLPVRFTCDGPGTAPPLAWSGVPPSARSVALVVDDPDAPGETYTHWVVAGLARTATSIDAAHLPTGAVQAESSAGSARYTPPCPPSGTHHYRFTVLALNVRHPFADGTATSEALDRIDAAAIARGTLVGLYSRG